MKISWKRKKLYEYVSSFAKSNPITYRRMNSIKAAVSFLDLVPESNGRAHFLEGKYKGHFSIDLEYKGNGKRLICIPVGVDEDKSGHYDKAKIFEFMVVDIEDYH